MRAFNSFKVYNFKYAYFISNLLIEFFEFDNVEEKFSDFWESYEEYVIEWFSNFFKEKIKILARPSKNTILHEVIYDVLDMLLDKEIHDFKDYGILPDYTINKDYVDNSLISRLNTYNKKAIEFAENLKIKYEYFIKNKISEEEWDTYYENTLTKIENDLKEINLKITDEVFYLLYNDKLFLFEFNKFISKYISKMDSVNYNDYMTKEGYIRRYNHLPIWLQNAVYFRDKGICQCCGKDISGFTRILQDRERHFDHIIPLEKGGTNDPTNYQLLCGNCNSKKHTKISKPKCYYLGYW